MATDTSTSSAASTSAPAQPIGFRPLDWWADLDVDGFSEPPRRTPPIPAFVRLSRLVDPNRRSTERTAGAVVEPEMSPTDERVLDDASTPASIKGWADSAGRPLFQIGLAAIIAALFVGVTTFGSSGENLTTVESPDAGSGLNPGIDETTGHPADDDRTRGVLEALVRQSSDAGEADLSLGGTASTDQTDIRWTATVRNSGPETANGPISVVQTIGSEFELVSVVGNGWECEQMRAAGTIRCELDEDLAVGQRRRLGLVTSVGGVEPGTTIWGTMSVVAGTADPDLDNNTADIGAVAAPIDDDSADGTRSPSTGTAEPSGSSSDTDTSATASSTASSADQTNPAGMDELPHTGSGLALTLGVIGVGLCLSGRRMTSWSAQAQTRSLLAAANIR